MNSVVIAGAGQAGYQTAASLRQEGFSGSITLVGNEPGLPYQRPPLSKAYMLGKIGASALQFRPQAFFEQQRIDLIESSVVSIDRERRVVMLADRKQIAYDHLILALGARNRVPSVRGIGLDGVFGIRTLADADALAPRLSAAKRVVVVGAGFIGLEFAAVAAARGVSVDVLEIGLRPMARAVSAPTSTLFDQVHRNWGVRLHYGHGLQCMLEGEKGRVGAVQTTLGRQFDTDLVVYGIGVVPNIEVAREAGLAVENGVRVDEWLTTSDKSISAIGDLVSFPSPWAEKPVRLESVQNAVDQARTVAARLVGKAISPYVPVPWFWTDQGDYKLQIAGLADGHDETVVLADAAQRALTVLCFRRGRLIAVETTNRPSEHMAARKLLQRRTQLTPEEAAAPGFELKSYELANRPA
ncbi:3-phenylpropionate/trans-cinnamate dioxygenase ferredoxin reductase subunit [Trinickia symbiotica]|nr:FAD-dependent oxidoreductase [Trinickia symbiotica]PPK41010.1 3-phenylpropionate/trans-cinnamate dioxygenase ferredoxin reductase subunit [Trinickia symbiotica]